mgnify:CR=1 FL=1
MFSYESAMREARRGNTAGVFDYGVEKRWYGWVVVNERPSAKAKRMNELTKLRSDLGLTQLQLGRLMGMEVPSISRIENGGRALTRQHQATIKLIRLAHENGAISKLLDCDA